VEALIFKGLTAIKGTYQQSYPQKLWMTAKLLMNQRLKATFASSLQEIALNEDSA
jgi:hypothetical protein